MKTFKLSDNVKKQKEDVDIVGGSDGEGAIGLSGDPKSREQMINDRIGHKPQQSPTMSFISIWKF